VAAPDTLELREASRLTDGPPSIDRAKGVVAWVKVLGRKSLNAKTYTDAALDDAIRLFEGATVYIDHPAGSSNARGYRERFAKLVGLAKEPDGVYAKELRYNPSHALAEQFAWDVENNPTGFGLSINANTKRFRRERGGEVIVEGIDAGHSVDLVDNPATVKGLREQTGATMEPLTDPAAPTDTAAGDATDHKQHLIDAVSALAAELRDGADLADVRKKVAAILAMIDDGEGDAGKGDAEPTAEDEQKMTEQLAGLPLRAAKWAARKLDGIRLQERLAARVKLAESRKVPAVAITDVFKLQLREAKTDDEVNSLIDDRLRVVGVNRGPRSATPTPTGDRPPAKTVKQLADELVS
jgi:hypothetical protein